jgi:hypothetical protein
MGYAKIFWINETPVRSYLSVKGKGEAVTQEIGRRVLSICKDGSSPQPFMDEGLTFFPFRSFHATDFCVLVWTGQRLQLLPDIDDKQFDFICSLQHAVPPQHMITTLGKKERDLAVAAIHGWDNPLQNKGEFSIYYIYEDFTRDYTRSPEAKWPCNDVGVAISDLMLSNWNQSQGIRNHGNAVSRVCSFLKTEMCFFIWSLNCLRPLGSIGADEIKKMRDYLSPKE